MHRTIQKNVLFLLSKFPCVSVLGARQVGKSTLLHAVCPDRPFYDLELVSVYDRVKTDPDHFLSSLPDYQERLSAHIAALIGWLREKGVNIPAEEVTGAFNTGWVLRPIFMILSAPMTSLVKIALESYEETRGLAIMLGSGAKIE